jgi:hypothetical protein
MGMRWVFVFLCWCLLGGPTFARDRLEPIQACPLKRFPNPVAISHAQCAESHCVDLGQGRSVCKCVPESEEEPAPFILLEGNKEVQRWRADANLQRTDDFEVLSGDLPGDGKPLWIVANHDLSSQGMLVRFWSLHVLDPAAPTEPPISWSVSDYGPGSFALPRNRQEKGCDILLTEWLEGQDAQGKSGLYFRGRWYRLGTSGIVPLPSRKERVRRYLYSFERERAKTTSEDMDGPEHFKGNPALWLRPEKAVAYEPEKLTFRPNAGPFQPQ